MEGEEGNGKTSSTVQWYFIMTERTRWNKTRNQHLLHLLKFVKLVYLISLVETRRKRTPFSSRECVKVRGWKGVGQPSGVRYDVHTCCSELQKRQSCILAGLNLHLLPSETSIRVFSVKVTVLWPDLFISFLNNTSRHHYNRGRRLTTRCKISVLGPCSCL